MFATMLFGEEATTNPTPTAISKLDTTVFYTNSVPAFDLVRATYQKEDRD